MALASSHLSPARPGLSHAERPPPPPADPAGPWPPPLSLLSHLPRMLLSPVSAGPHLPFAAQPRPHLPQEALVVEVPLTPKRRVYSCPRQLDFQGAPAFTAETALPSPARSRPPQRRLCPLSPGKSSSLLMVSELTWGLQVSQSVCTQVPAAS